MNAKEQERSALLMSNRQEFLKRAALMGLAVSPVAGILGCGSSDKSTKAKGPTSAKVPTVGTEAVRTPAASGPLDKATWALNSEPSSMNWIYSYAPSDNTVLSNVTESLMRLTPEFDYEPSLAENMEAVDPTTYVFTLRQGVKFHDGSEMKADDVVYSMTRSLDPTSYWAPWLTSVDNVKKTGDYEVTVKLKQPDVIFPQMMALPPGAVNPAAAIKKGGESYGTPKALPVGTGPFKATKWTAGTSIELTKNDDYWDTENAAKTTSLTFSFLADTPAMVNALSSGQIDGSYAPPYDALDRLLKSSSGELYQGPSMLNSLMFWTTRKGPQLDAKIREAMLLATDRTAIAKTVYSGAAAPLPSTFVPEAVWGIGTDQVDANYAKLAPASGDLAKAKQLVEEAGGPPKETIKIAIKSSTLDEKTATIIQASAQQLGIKVSLEKLPAAELINLLYDEKARTKYHAFISSGYYSDIPDPVELFDELIGRVKEGALSYNYLEWSNAKVQGLIDKARKTDDDTERANILFEAQALQASEVPVFPIVAPASLVYISKKVSGVPASFCYCYYPWARDLGAA